MGGRFAAKLRFGGGAESRSRSTTGWRCPTLGVLSDGNPANARRSMPRHGSPARPATLTITKGTDAARLAAARDALFWVEYAETV